MRAFFMRTAEGSSKTNAAHGKESLSAARHYRADDMQPTLELQSIKCKAQLSADKHCWYAASG
jgi:hypothetical protein